MSEATQRPGNFHMVYSSAFVDPACRVCMVAFAVDQDRSRKAEIS